VFLVNATVFHIVTGVFLDNATVFHIVTGVFLDNATVTIGILIMITLFYSMIVVTMIWR